jgi:hypothetical protein
MRLDLSMNMLPGKIAAAPGYVQYQSVAAYLPFLGHRLSALIWANCF